MNSTSVAPTMASAAPAIVLSNGDTNCATTGSLTKLPKMYNLNVNVNVSAANTAVTNLLAVESACTTPRTPEILNSLIAMTNPMDDYNYNVSEKSAIGGLRGGSGNDSNSNSSGSPLGSPGLGSTPSIQKTCSELIKAGLKLSIESKRKMSGSDSMDGLPCSKKLKKEEPYISDDDYDDSYIGNRGEGDEERRRRRRERNKIAATKCRLKKRERTVKLVSESEVLETQNVDLKTQIQELEVQRRQLVDMLSQHTTSCVRHTNSSPTTPYNPIQLPYDSPNSYPVSATPYEPTSPYIRPESANILASSYTCELENPPPSNYNQPVDSLDLQSTYSIPTSDGNYMRHDNQNYINDETYKGSNLLLVESSENEYLQIPFETQDINHQYNPANQQCHNLNSTGTRQKFRNSGMDNGCMA